MATKSHLAQGRQYGKKSPGPRPSLWQQKVTQDYVPTPEKMATQIPQDSLSGTGEKAERRWS